MTTSVYDFVCETITGESKPLHDYQGKVLLIVNTASRCGLTPQLKGLEKLYKQYSNKGLEILGFPCNQFAKQDPGSNEQIQAFCELKYGVSFPMFAKIDVNGADTHPLFGLLKMNAPGVMGSHKIKWNFTKFLISPKGEVIKRYAPATSPKKIESDINQLLKTT